MAARVRHKAIAAGVAAAVIGVTPVPALANSNGVNTRTSAVLVDSQEAENRPPWFVKRCEEVVPAKLPTGTRTGRKPGLKTPFGNEAQQVSRSSIEIRVEFGHLLVTARFPDGVVDARAYVLNKKSQREPFVPRTGKVGMVTTFDLGSASKYLKEKEICINFNGTVLGTPISGKAVNPVPYWARSEIYRVRLEEQRRDDWRISVNGRKPSTKFWDKYAVQEVYVKPENSAGALYSVGAKAGGLRPVANSSPQMSVENLPYERGDSPITPAIGGYGLTEGARLSDSLSLEPKHLSLTT